MTCTHYRMIRNRMNLQYFSTMTILLHCQFPMGHAIEASVDVKKCKSTVCRILLSNSEKSSRSSVSKYF